MADTPIWVTLITPVVSALATWLVTKLDLLSFSDLSQFKGTWYAYYRDPDGSHEIRKEIWEFSAIGTVSVQARGKITFKGRLKLIGNKALMSVVSTHAKTEGLQVLMDAPNDPRGYSRPCVAVWLGSDGSHRITAGHALLSKNELTTEEVENEFLRAMDVTKLG
ncbi:hypothetical protein [Methylomonas albis]|uniref:Lipocalin-like domain-containing protein n=1 Tax=Methylomonas albis TaxID=1854563 RepID=A0ABR9D578_9GAMM|nr:hypothetical protein [Methylomonas albis]MBD9357369.1 hypothetical protein [Methylomonas albis]CAD6880624.1 hypothetical protein [Methylomonas albis]